MSRAEHATFGELLKKHRLAMRLSQEELAETAGLSARDISRLERGVRLCPHRDTVRLLALALGLSPEEASSLAASGRGLDAPHPGPLSAEMQVRHPSSSFVGREREVAEVRQLLGMTDLLTLTGAGGAGKTRLALAVIASVAGEYTDGLRVVELAPLAEPDLVPGAVAAAVGVREEPNVPLIDTLVCALQPRQMLLVLDNCEHLVEACAELAEELLSSCLGLTILTTSREVLRVGGELSWQVPPLSLPLADLLALPPPMELQERYEAVRLFVERARSHQPEFSLTPENSPHILKICRWLGGLPLGIELAAARVGVLGVEQLAARLGDALSLLGGGERRAPARQRTLRATLDWSYDLLEERERRLLGCLSVFAGGFSLEAVEQVCLGESDCKGDGVLETWFGLVDKSLVVARTDAEGWVQYGLLEPVREYARERLVRGGLAEVEAARYAHAKYYVALAGQAEREWRGPQQREWLDRLETEHDNLRTALRWYLDRGDAEAYLRLAGHLWWFCDMRGHLDEVRGWMETGLAANREVSATVRARVLTSLGMLVWQQGEYERAEALQEEALALYREAGYERGAANALNSLGLVALDRGEYHRAKGFFEESLRLREGVGDAWGVAVSLNNLGLLAVNTG